MKTKTEEELRREEWERKKKKIEEQRIKERDAEQDRLRWEHRRRYGDTC